MGTPVVSVPRDVESPRDPPVPEEGRTDGVLSLSHETCLGFRCQVRRHIKTTLRPLRKDKTFFSSVPGRGLPTGPRVRGWVDSTPSPVARETFDIVQPRHRDRQSPPPTRVLCTRGALCAADASRPSPTARSGITSRQTRPSAVVVSPKISFGVVRGTWIKLYFLE